jgi:hypothetical protein
MLVFYDLEDRSPWYILAFAAACSLASAYGFLQGAWPFGVIEAIWAGVAVWRWRTKESPTDAWMTLATALGAIARSLKSIITASG